MDGLWTKDGQRTLAQGPRTTDYTDSKNALATRFPDRPRARIVPLVAQAIFRAPLKLWGHVMPVHLLPDALQLILEGGAWYSHSRRPCRRLVARHGVCPRDVGMNAGDDDSCFHGEEIDTGERDADPRVNHDPLVEDMIEHVDHAGPWRDAIDGHG